MSYRTVYDPVVGSHGGCLFYIRRDVCHVPFTLNTNIEATAVQINIGRMYTICNIYLPPNEPISYEDLHTLLRQLPPPYILLGDFNARHPLWGDVLSNSKGNTVASLVEHEDLCVFNTGEPTHFHIQTGSLSCIDLTLGSANCMLDFNWKILDDMHCSDHAPIIIQSNDGEPMQGSPKWCLDKADWALFKDKSEINENADDLPSVNDGIDLLNTTLHSAGLQSIKRSTGLFRRRPVP